MTLLVEENIENCHRKKISASVFICQIWSAKRSSAKKIKSIKPASIITELRHQAAFVLNFCASDNYDYMHLFNEKVVNSQK